MSKLIFGLLMITSLSVFAENPTHRELADRFVDQINQQLQNLDGEECIIEYENYFLDELGHLKKEVKRISLEKWGGCNREALESYFFDTINTNEIDIEGIGGSLLDSYNFDVE